MTAYGLVMATQALGKKLTIQSGKIPSLSLFVGTNDVLKQVLTLLRILQKKEPEEQKEELR